MRRREFIGLAGGVAVWPGTARAQQPTAKGPVIGWISLRAASESADLIQAFQRGLAKEGYVEGKNVLVDYRWSDGNSERFPELINELVDRRVDVIVSPGATTATVVARKATNTIPIVFSTSADPVALGLVNALNRPGGNATGVTTLGGELGPKRVELLHELIPSATEMVLFVNPTSPTATPEIRDFNAAMAALGIKGEAVEISKLTEFEASFSHLSQRDIRGLVIGADAFFTTNARLLGALSLQYSIASIYQYPEFVGSGGLASYGSSFIDSVVDVGAYAGRILKGEKPEDLPVLQATRAEFIINLKTARALGISVPLPLLGRADEVIE